MFWVVSIKFLYVVPRFVRVGAAYQRLCMSRQKGFVSVRALALFICPRKLVCYTYGMTLYKALFSKWLVSVSLVLISTSSAYAVTAYDGTAPTAPTNIKATAYVGSPTRVVISWNQAQDNIGVTRYNIYKNGTFMVTPQGVGVTFTDFDVVMGQTYKYSIQAGDGDGNNGPQSDTIQITVAEGSLSSTTSPLQVISSPSMNTSIQQVTSVYSNTSLKTETPQMDHPEAVSMTTYEDKLEISWKNPVGNKFKTVRVIKKDTSYPVSPTDGKVICDSLVVMKCTDKEVVPGKTYYYGVYAADQSYLASQLVLVTGVTLEKKQKASTVQVTSQPAGLVPASGASQVLTPSNSALLFTKTLMIGSTGGEVLLLQKFLNTNGFIITASGPGSPGNETSVFGRATEKALQKYQCSKKIVCDGTPSSTGYGMVGKTTRGYLNRG